VGKDEVVPVDHIGSRTVDTRQDDCAAGYADMRIASNSSYRDLGTEIGVSDAEAAEVDLVLAAIRIGVEACDGVRAEIGFVVDDGIEAAAHIDRVIPGAAMDGIVPGASVQRIVAFTAEERVIAVTANEPVVAEAAIETVGTRSEEHTSELQSRENLV